MDFWTILTHVAGFFGAAGLLVWLLVRKIVVPQTCGGLLYRNGRFIETLAPGARWRFRRGASVLLIDLRQWTVTVPGQEVLTSDSVGLKVSLSVRFSVTRPEHAVHRVADYSDSLYALVQIALREEVGALSIDNLQERRADIGAGVLRRVQAEAEAFGVTVDATEVKDAMFPGDLKRAFAEVIKAKKEGEAAIEKARGESAALRNLQNAAKLLEKNPALYQLRVLESADIAGKTPGNTLVLGVPPTILK